jgi:hypothetical protein
MATNVSHRAERPQQLKVPLYVELKMDAKQREARRDASDRTDLPFPVSEAWSILLSLEHLMHRDARSERIRNVGSGQCDSRTLVLAW